MESQDLREFLNRVNSEGMLVKVTGANTEEEIGVLSEVTACQPQPPAVLFDDIPSYPKGYRVAVNLLATSKLFELATGRRVEYNLQGVRAWKRMIQEFHPLTPREVSDGAVLENKHVGAKVDVERFPTPRWHAKDVGRYIGTACMVVSRDRDTGYVNSGAYRVMIHDKKTLGHYVAPATHEYLIRKKYWDHGEPCPVVVIAGVHPAIWCSSGVKVPWGLSEYDVAGHLIGHPVEVVRGPETDLPIPAQAEIAIEGEVPPPEEVNMVEGPFGENNGYYAGGARPEPIIRVKSVLFRNDPILVGAPPFKPPSYWNGGGFVPVSVAAYIWEALDKLEIPGITGVWLPDGGRSHIVIIALKQLFPGHPKRAAMGCLASSAGGYRKRFIILVDDDVDPSNMQEVLWALGTRCDPATTVDVMHGMLSGPLDSMIFEDQRSRGDYTSNVAIVNACKPWGQEFPETNSWGQERMQVALKKWEEQLRR